MNDDTARASLREAFLLLNRDFQQLSQRVTEWITDHDKRLTRGGERFARIDLSEQRVSADLASLQTNYVRAMAEIERVQGRVADLDRQIGATIRLANRVQFDLATLQKEHDALHHIVTGERGNDEDRGMEGDIGQIRAEQATWKGRAIMFVIVYLATVAMMFFLLGVR